MQIHANARKYTTYPQIQKYKPARTCVIELTRTMVREHRGKKLNRISQRMAHPVPCTTQMNLNKVVTILCQQLESWKSSPYYCPFTQELKNYRNSSELLQACGHDVHELNVAIIATEKAFQELKVARDRAVARFHTEGVCFTVDENKRSELEAKRKEIKARALQ